MDIALIGHLVDDLIFDGDKHPYRQAGGIANVRRAIERISPETTISVEPCAFGFANIQIDRETSSKLVTANLNVETRRPTLFDSRWSHIAYLNKLPDDSFVSEIGGVISADTCADGDISFWALKYVDFLFVAKDELHYSIEELSQYVKGWTIEHSPEGSFAVNGNEKISCLFPHPKLTHINCLGAGDFFASCFTISQMRGENIKESLEFGHAETHKFLKHR